MGRQGTLLRGWGQLARLGALMVGSLALAHCSGPLTGKEATYSPRVVEEGEPVPKGGGIHRAGKPDTPDGRGSAARESAKYRSEGVASWYGRDFHGRRTANGEVYDMHGISAAHPTMPLPSYARVTNLSNGRSIIVRVNNRGPFVRGRVVDVSIGAAKALNFYKGGLAEVRVEYVGRAPLEGSDDGMLLATLRDSMPAPAPSKVMVASAKPFLPASAEAVPTDRPHAAARSRPAGGPLVTSSISPSPSPPATRESRRESDAPAAAFAPLGGPALGLMSGRGLY
jgi:rare lipoprotein A